MNPDSCKPGHPRPLSGAGWLPSIPSLSRHCIVAGLGIQAILVSLALAMPASAADIDPDTGLVIAAGYTQVKAQCTACHSSRLVTQSRADREGWLQMIRWMHGTQGLWPLGDAEPVILDYLAEHYAPVPRGRRAALHVSFE